LSNVVAIAGGVYHSLALTGSGTVAAWGDNTYGETTIPAGLSNVVAIAAGDTFSLALTGSGTVVAWGSDGNAQANLPSGLANVLAIAAGPFHSLALTGSGTVVGWGNNGSGQTTAPLGMDNTVAIAAGGYHSLARLTGQLPTIKPVIINTPFALGELNEPFQLQIDALNAPSTYGATVLPAGLTINHSTGLISGAPTVGGTSTVVLSATNGAGGGQLTLKLGILTPSSPGGSGSVTRVTPISQWRLSNFGIAGDTGKAANTATPTGDGIANLLKYAIGASPLRSSLESLPVIGFESVAGKKYLTITFTHALDATDATCYVDVSGNLSGSWSQGSMYSPANGDVPSNTYTTQVSRTVNPDGVTETIVVRDNVPLSQATSRFIRLRVTQP
jgi:hypothetical protein